MKQHRTFLTGCITVLAAAVAAACNPRADAFELMEADRAFNDAVAAGGSTAWVSWFAPEGAMIQQGAGEIRGHERIAATVTYLDDPAFSLSWEPLRADIAASGDLGWTTGRYRSEVRNPDGTVRRGEGRYVSIWRRQADDSWKVVMDLGNPTTPPPQ